jgi:WD40 repeat protein
LGNSEALLQEILDWTGGQPFLTQKICVLARKIGERVLPGEEKEWIERLVKKQVIENSQDEPPHLQTIRDRLLTSKRGATLLGLYQKILEHSQINFDESPEQMELRQSGLVVKEKEYLRVYNRIYELFFNKNWASKNIDSLSPYNGPYLAWSASNKNKTFLLNAKQLIEVKAWSNGKNLSDENNLFIAESEKQNKQIKQFKIILLSLFTVFMISNLLGTGRKLLSEKYNLSCTSNQVSNDVTTMDFIEDDKSLVTADSYGEIKKLTVDSICSKPVSVAKHKDIVTMIKFNPKEKQIASASLDGTVVLSKLNKNKYSNFTLRHESPVTSIDFRPNSNYLATSTADGVVRVWDTANHREITKESSNKDYIGTVVFSPNGQYLAANNLNTFPKIWKWHKNKLEPIKDTQRILDKNPKIIAFSPNNSDKKANYLAVGYTNGKITILELKDSQIIKVVASLDFDDELKKILFSPDGDTLAIISFNLNQRAKLWKWQKHPEDQRTISLGPDGNSASAFSLNPNTKFLALANPKEVRVWSTENYKFIGRLPLKRQPVAIDFNPTKEGKKESLLIVNTQGFVSIQSLSTQK